MNNGKEEKGANSTSFWELLTETKKIEIPIIQRDYAQGREDAKTTKLRGKFLDDLIQAIRDKEKTLELDFVYGKVEKCVFKPLDGQQRLTTLFLLHWFLALKTHNLKENKSQFSKFTYETRISSREFCQELIEKNDELGEGNRISDQITDSAWFFLAWKNDPTIKAMLVMLDCIEEKLKNEKEGDYKKLWTRLISDNSPITFYFKELNAIGLTDDLYIKMNARGIPLTDFENFKASFEQFIKEKGWEKALKDDPTERFAHKIDTVWTDLFWKYRNKDNKIDDAYIKFIAGIAMNCYAQNFEISSNEENEMKTKTKLSKKNSHKKITNDEIKKERISKRITFLFNNPNEVIPKDFPTKKAFEYLKKCLDIYSNKSEEYNKKSPNKLPLWGFCKDELIKINGNDEMLNTLFSEFIKKDETTYKQRVLFYAQTQFLLKSESFDEERFSDWMRVVRNIIENSAIDSAENFRGAINLINEISKGCDDIYAYLSNDKVESRFAKKQVEEEVLKAFAIEKNQNNKEAIFATEDTKFCRGKIKFALYCVDYTTKEDEFNSNSLVKLQKVIKEYLSGNDISNKFRSALLTIGKNDFYTYWGTWSYKTETNKKCLIEDTNDLKNIIGRDNYQNYLKELLNKLINKPLDEIIREYLCPENMQNWKKRLIKETELLDDFCSGHYFGVTEDDKSCFLFYHRKRPRSRKKCKKIE